VGLGGACAWKQHLLQGERLTTEEKHVIDQLHGLRIEPNPHEKRICISVDGEVSQTDPEGGTLRRTQR